jgi:hypothetical protein
MPAMKDITFVNLSKDSALNPCTLDRSYHLFNSTSPCPT